MNNVRTSVCRSLLTRIVLWAFALTVIAAGVAIILFLVTRSIAIALAATAAAMAIATWWSGYLLLVQPTKILRAIADGVQSLRDNDFTIRISQTTRDELSEVVAAYNDLIDTLSKERQNLNQRELLLDTVIQATPLSLVLTNVAGNVLYTNIAARRLFYQGRQFEGMKFRTLLQSAPQPLREAMDSPADTLFTLQWEEEPKIFHLSRRQFGLNGHEHRLYLITELTREINTQEIATWKKAIRVIAHEINNSLAPMSSLMHSGKLLLGTQETSQLARVFETVQDRVAHLRKFIDGYARFAKLPKPKTETVYWPQFVESLRRVVPFKLDGVVPEMPATFDPAQISQALINVIKNSLEAGSPSEEVCVRIGCGEHGVHIEVRDRGAGMSEAALRSALLPFYSTKSSGTGLGLTLCREILEAHGGQINLVNRADGGAIVTLWLPVTTAADNRSFHSKVR